MEKPKNEETLKAPQKDLCALCGKESPYDSQTHIEDRVGYIEGAGQTCFDPLMCKLNP